MVGPSLPRRVTASVCHSSQKAFRRIRCCIRCLLHQISASLCERVWRSILSLQCANPVRKVHQIAVDLLQPVVKFCHVPRTAADAADDRAEERQPDTDERRDCLRLIPPHDLLRSPSTETCVALGAREVEECIQVLVDPGLGEGRSFIRRIFGKPACVAPVKAHSLLLCGHHFAEPSLGQAPSLEIEISPSR